MMKKQLFSSVFVNPRTHQWARIIGSSHELESLLSLSSSSSSYSSSRPWPSQPSNNNNYSTHKLLIAKIKETNERLLTGQRQEWYRIQLGLTKRGLDDIGDISHFERKLSPTRQPKTRQHQQQDQQRPVDGWGEEIKRHQEFLKIVHEGHAITAADEMYHTVWDTITEELSIVSPTDGWVISSESAVHDEGDDKIARYVDDETILMDMISTKEECMDVFPLSSIKTMSGGDPTIRRSGTGDDVGDTGDYSDYHQQMFIHERDYFNLIVPSLPPGKYAED